MGSFNEIRFMRNRRKAHSAHHPGTHAPRRAMPRLSPLPVRLANLRKPPVKDDTLSEALPPPGAAEPAPGHPAIHLGSLEIRTTARTILVDGKPAELGGRGFDLLAVLLEARGEIVSKDDLLSQVWPTVTVVDSNLKVQLSLLRRALGSERWRVKTISGRGYLLVCDDARTAPVTTAPLPPAFDNQLIIVVDADRLTQELIVQALSRMALSAEGLTRLSLVTRGGDAQLLAS